MEPRLRFNLDDLLKQNKLKASDLSKLTGIPKQTLSEWRSGLVPKSILSLKKVASAFGVSLDELVFRANNLSLSLTPLPEAAAAKASNIAFELARCGTGWLEAVMALRVDGESIFLTQTAADWLGWDQNLILNRSIFEFVSIDTVAILQAELRSALATGLPRSLSCRFLQSDLRLRSCRCFLVPLRNEPVVLSILLPENSPDPAPLDIACDEVRWFALEPCLQLVQSSFKACHPDINLSLPIASQDFELLSRRYTFAQILLSSLLEIARMLKVASSADGQTLELMAYQDQHELGLEIQAVAPSLAPGRLGRLALLEQLLLAVNGQIKLQDWGPVWKLSLIFPRQFPRN